MVATHLAGARAGQRRAAEGGALSLQHRPAAARLRRAASHDAQARRQRHLGDGTKARPEVIARNRRDACRFAFHPRRCCGEPGHPMFRWQEIEAKDHAGRVQCLEQWISQGRTHLEGLVPGCGFECLLPDAYHINLRESDRRVRPYAIRAAVHLLTHALDADAQQLRASIAPFGEERVDEYRVGLSVGDSDEVSQGVVWPLLGAETDADEPSPLEAIRDALRDTGVDRRAGVAGNARAGVLRRLRRAALPEPEGRDRARRDARRRRARGDAFPLERPAASGEGPRRRRGSTSEGLRE